jgi:hypothetical protein
MRQAVSESTVTRFEATDIGADADQEVALLLIETEERGRVAIHMQRAVFDTLCERILHAQEQSTALDPDHSTD